MSRNALKIMRYLACGLLLLSLTLPISKCQNNYKGLEGFLPVPATESPPTIYYPIDFIDFKDIVGIMMLLVFIWPVLAVLVRRRILKPRAQMVLSVIELIMCIGSGWAILTLGSIGRMLIGGYVGLAGACLHLVTSAAEFRNMRNIAKAAGPPDADSPDDDSRVAP